MDIVTSYFRLFGAATLSGALLFFPLAHAQPQGIQSARNEVQDAVHGIEQVGDADNAAVAALKKDVLLKIVAFSKLEGEQMLTDIRELSLENARPELGIIQTALIEELEKAVAHFSAVLSALTESQFPSTRELETVAASFREWRATTYDPLVKSALNLAIVMQTEGTLQTAETRFAKISAAVKKISAFATNPSFETLLADAGLNLRNARLFLNRAKDTFIRAHLPFPNPRISRVPASTLSAIPTVLSQEKTSVEYEMEARQLIEQGLHAIKNAYGNFIDMNKLITELVRGRTKQ